MRTSVDLVRASLIFSSLLGAQLIPASALGQTRPDAGRILEQVSPEPASPASSTIPFELEERPAIALAADESLPVARLRITGATQFPVEQLHAQIADGEGKTLSLAELQGLAQRLTGFYRERGYLLTRAYLPAQQIEAGVVEIAVLEGRLSELRIHNGSRVGGSALAPLKNLETHEPLTTHALERALLLAADTPGVNIASTLTPGAHVGTSDLMVEVAPGRRFGGSISADTYGNRATGAFRPGVDFNLNNPLNAGDQLTFEGLASLEDLYYLRAGYELPVGRWGTRLGASYAWLDYALGEEFAALDADGTAKITSLRLQQSLIRSRRLNLYGQLQYDDRKLEDRLGAFQTDAHKQLDDWTLGFAGDFRDCGGRGANSFSMSYTRGRLNLDSLSVSFDALTAQTRGTFRKWNLNYQRLQSLLPRLDLYFSYVGQLADGNLDSAEKMSVGGAHGVRAYPQGEASGDEAHLFALEARWRVSPGLPGEWQLRSFLDYGRVRLNDTPWSAEDNHRELTGAGVGLNLNASSHLRFEASVAWRVGEERPASDSDKSPRAWLYAASKF